MKYKDRVRITGFYEGTGTVISVEKKTYGGIVFTYTYLVELDVDLSTVWIDAKDLEVIK